MSESQSLSSLLLVPSASTQAVTTNQPKAAWLVVSLKMTKTMIKSETLLEIIRAVNNQTPISNKMKLYLHPIIEAIVIMINGLMVLTLIVHY
jgi:hypothetical protein